MKNTPINYAVVEAKIKENYLANVGKASIREIKKLVNDVESETGEKYVRMEMGIPGLPAVQIGVDAELEAHRKGVASIYPDIHGIPPLKKEMSRFIKMFLDVNVNPPGAFQPWVLSRVALPRS